MKRLLTASIFGTILTLTGAYSTANASIVSSGFLDEKLTEYALSTSLDLKANQSDLTALSNKIGNDWPFNIDMMAGLHFLVPEIYAPETSLKNTSDLAHFLFGGALESGLYANAPGVLNLLGDKIIRAGDYDFLSGKELDGFRSLTQLTNGWTSTDGTTYLGVKDLNTKIGTLPSGNFPLFTGAESLFSEVAQPLTYPTSLAELINAIYGYKNGMPGLLGSIFAGSPLDYDQDGRTDGYIGLIPNYQLAKNANDKIGTLPEGITLQGLYEQWNRVVSDFVSNLKSLWDPTNTKSILSGTDPNKFSNDISSAFNATYIIFERIMSALSYGWRDIDTNTYYSGIIDLNEGWLDKSTNTTYQGVKALNDGWLDKSTNTTYQGVKGLNDVIGTLPTQISGNDTTWVRYGFETPIELPTTVGGMFDMLFHDERDSTERRFSLSTIMAHILTGLYRDNGSAIFYGLYDLTDALELRNNRDNYPLVNAVNANTAAIEKIGTVPDGKNLAGMISETDAKIGTVPDGQTVAGMATTANTTANTAKTTADSAIEKIGTLPTEYATVGAALSAIKGIAEEAKTAALAAIPDPKTEGATGKYVLTVDIIDSSATPVYRWEKIDRESEPTTTE